MDHGTKSKINAVATLTGKILPVYFPTMKYIEEGCHVIMNDGVNVLVSPDGSIGQTELQDDSPSRYCACEFKCPVGNEYCTPVHYQLPSRVSFDEELWDMMMSEAQSIYGGELKKKTRCSENAKIIKAKIEDFKSKNVEFLCEVESLRGTNETMCFITDESPYKFPIGMFNENQLVEDNHVETTFSNVSSALNEAYELNRRKATEVIVWLLSDSDRKWNAEIPHSVPAAYAMKGYSLGTSVMRNIHEHVLQACNENDVRVMCSCFDGQWIRLATRSADDRPLTMVQFQKDVEEKATKTSRNAIIQDLTATPIAKDIQTDVIIERNLQTGSITVQHKVLDRMMVSAKRSKTNRKEDKKKPTGSETPGTLSLLPVDALESLSDEQTLHNTLEAETSEMIADTTSHEATQKTEYAVEANENVVDQSTQKNVQSLSETIFQHILHELKSHSKSNIKKRWPSNKSVDDLKCAISNTHELHKMMHDELNVLIGNTKQIQQQCGMLIRKSWKSFEKANGLAKLIGSGEQLLREKMVNKVYSLKECSARVLRSNPKAVSKNELNCVYAASIFESERKIWIDNGPFDESTHIENVGDTTWFSVPEYNETRQKYEPKCLDAHHLLVNSRAKVCKDGVDDLKKEAWHSVAEQHSNILNKALVVDLIDKQNNAFALKIYSVEVENAMSEMGFHNEAEFCNIIRSWYAAEDEPGITAIERTYRRLRMKEYLLHNVDFGVFPPYGKYVKGFPKVWFEGMLQRIDTTLQLYLTTGSYNQRAVSSLVNETFFGELSDMEPTRLGCPKAVAIPRLMATVTELLHYRCDPSDRVFHMNTTRKSVYQKQPILPISPEIHGNNAVEDEDRRSRLLLCYVIMNSTLRKGLGNKEYLNEVTCLNQERLRGVWSQFVNTTKVTRVKFCRRLGWE